jgi:hypothetical protein
VRTGRSVIERAPADGRRPRSTNPDEKHVTDCVRRHLSSPSTVGPSFAQLRCPLSESYRLQNKHPQWWGPHMSANSASGPGPSLAGHRIAHGQRFAALEQITSGGLSLSRYDRPPYAATLAVKGSLEADQRFKPVITSITNPSVKNVIVAGILRQFRCHHHFTALRTGGPPKISFVQIAHWNASIESHD